MYVIYPQEGDLVVLTDVDPGVERLAITDLLKLKLTDGIRPQALEAALTVASKIGRVVLQLDPVVPHSPTAMDK